MRKNYNHISHFHQTFPPPPHPALPVNNDLKQERRRRLRELCLKISFHYHNNFAIFTKSLGMENVIPHSKNKIGENSVDMLREN